MLSSNSKLNELNIYIENESSSDTLIDVSIKMDEHILEKDKIGYSEITPNYKSYKFEASNGVHILEIMVEELGISETVEIDIQEDKYVIATYKFEIKPSASYGMEMMKFNTLKSDQQFTYDSILIPRQFELHVMDSLPVFQ